SDTFPRRHLGPESEDLRAMLETLGLDTLHELIEQAVPKAIRLKRPLKLSGLVDKPRGEQAVLNDHKTIASKNKIFRSLIGAGYADTITPPVILRNVLENPGWYTA